MATVAPAAARDSSDRAFYLGMALAFVAVVFVGFARSFFLRPLFPVHPSPREPIFYVHGALFTAWCVLLVGQTALVRAHRTALHRRIGPWGAVLAAAMVAVGTHGALVAARRPTGFVSIPAPPQAFLIVPFVDMLLFGTFVAIAVVKRRDSPGPQALDAPCDHQPPHRCDRAMAWRVRWDRRCSSSPSPTCSSSPWSCGTAGRAGPCIARRPGAGPPSCSRSRCVSRCRARRPGWRWRTGS